MTTSPDHPELQFIQAENYTTGRPDGPPILVVMHTMEAHELPTTAESTARYFANPPDGRNVSAHYCCDNDSMVQCVLLKDSAWTAGSRYANNRGINVELAGFASQTAAQWADPFSVAMLQRAAPIIRADCAKYGIPIRRLTVPQLKAGLSGITSHNDCRLAFGGTTHTDPGPNFPWDFWLSLLKGEDMSTAAEYAHNADTATFAIATLAPGYKAFPTDPLPGTSIHTNNLAATLIRLETKVDAIIEALGDGSGNVDVAAILAGMQIKLDAQQAELEAAIEESEAQLREEIRDSDADALEGGAAAVRADPDA
jgi:N-acetyl-anhydromuramyl-L-alanine amidase AmpD